MDYDRTSLEARVLAAVVHRPPLIATATHHIVRELWQSANAWQEPRLRIVAEAAWTCWETGRDTSAANIARISLVPSEVVADALSWLLGCYAGESESSLDKLARELAQLIRRDDLGDILRQGLQLIAGAGEPADQIADIQRLVASAPGSALNIVGADESARQLMATYLERKDGRGGPIGIPTGFPDIDRAMGGLPVSAITILGARPSQGKTAISSCIAIAALKAGHPVIFFSHEMLASDIMQRMACQYKGLSYAHLRTGKLSTIGERKLAAAMEWLKSRQLYIIDTGSPTPQDCRNTAMYLINRLRSPLPPLVIVDYIQLEHIKGTRQTRADELTDISSMWVATAKETGAACLMLAQLNRQADGSQPKMAQLRESGALEQDANAVMLLWRPAKDRNPDDNAAPDPNNRTRAGYNWAVLSVAKSRNSDLSEQELYWDGYCMRYRPWEAEDRQLSRLEAARAEYNQYLNDIIRNA